MTTKETQNTNSHVRCIKCNKLLAKNSHEGHLEIKCLRCSELNLVFERPPDQVIVTDSDGKILYINKSTEKQTGYKYKEAIGKKPSDLWGAEMPKEFYEKMWQIIKEEKKMFQGIITNKKKTGEEYKIKLVISPVLGVDNNILFYVATEVVLNN